MAGHPGLWAVALGAAALLTGGATAQSVATPAEFPPASYGESQFVDSTGCAFIRAGNGGVVNWVPRVTRNREQLCGFLPTFGDAEPAEAVNDIAEAPVIEIAADDVPAETPAPVVAPVQVRAPAPQPIRTTRPAAPERAPVVAPVVAAPPAAPEPRRVTRAEICAEIAATGKEVINANTGAPVVCPQATPVSAVNGAPSAPGAPTMAAAPMAPALQAPATPLVAPAQTSQPLMERPAPRVANPLAIFARKEVPASNPDPASVAGEHIAPPPGYERVWKDGRINPHRGLRRITREDAIAMGLVGS